MNKKRTIKLGKAYVSYRSRPSSIDLTLAGKNNIGPPVPFNSFSPGHPILGNLKDNEKSEKSKK